jgi:hypothetical protein
MPFGLCLTSFLIPEGKKNPRHQVFQPEAGDAVFHPRKYRLQHPVHEAQSKHVVLQVFRLPDHPTCRAFPSHSDSGFIAVLVSGYGGGSATDFNRLPCLRN